MLARLALPSGEQRHARETDSHSIATGSRVLDFVPLVAEVGAGGTLRCLVRLLAKECAARSGSSSRDRDFVKSFVNDKWGVCLPALLIRVGAAVLARRPQGANVANYTAWCHWVSAPSSCSVRHYRVTTSSWSELCVGV